MKSCYSCIKILCLQICYPNFAVAHGHMEPNLGHSVINPISIVSIKWPSHPLNMHVFSTEVSKSQGSHALKNIQLIWDKSKERTEKAPARQGGPGACWPFGRSFATFRAKTVWVMPLVGAAGPQFQHFEIRTEKYGE